MKCELRDDRKEDILLGLGIIVVLAIIVLVLILLIAGLGYAVTQSEIMVFTLYATSPMEYYTKSGLAIIFLIAFVVAVGHIVVMPLYLLFNGLFNGIKKLCSKQGRQQIKDFWFKCEE